MDAPVAGPAQLEGGGRPTARLPLAQLLQVSVYWFGINAVWGGWSIVSQERIPELVPHDQYPLWIAVIAVLGMMVPLLLQPTIGSISDYTMSRWGRRKPYIAIGATLDVVFLVGIATSQTYLTLLVFFVLLQFSSNFAQGPFQGYVPDLVPEEQVGLASGLMGMMSMLGLIGGTVVLSVGYATRDFTMPIVAVGVMELATALGTVLWVREGRAAKPRGGRSWRSIALETWGTDILQNRSYVWLLVSRFFLLAAPGTFQAFYVRYLTDSLGMSDADKAVWVPVIAGLLVVAMAIGAILSASLSDRLGRKRLIYFGAACGAAGLAIVAIAPAIQLATVGGVLIGFGGGNFLAVDWALMTDIIPAASAGRYMGMSNVATATNGPAATVLAAVVISLVGLAAGFGLGVRAAFLVAVGLYGIGALCLRPVVEPRRTPTGLAKAAVPAGS